MQRMRSVAYCLYETPRSLLYVSIKHILRINYIQLLKEEAELLSKVLLCKYPISVSSIFCIPGGLTGNIKFGMIIIQYHKIIMAMRQRWRKYCTNQYNQAKSLNASRRK